MPAAYAHIIFGNRVLGALPDHVRDPLIYSNIDVFEVGLQGPDILFYYRPLSKNSVSALGNAMHEQTGREWFLTALHRFGAQQGEPEISPAALAYLYGVLCHFVLDSQCHDYINQYVRDTGISHYEVESEFDRSLMLYRRQNPLTTSRIPDFDPSSRVAHVIEPFYDGVDEKMTKEALDSFVKFHRLLRCASNAKRNFIYAALHLLGKYDELHGHIINRWPNPGCESSNAELFARMDAAIPIAVRLISGFSEKEVLTDPQFELNFEGVRP